MLAFLLAGAMAAADPAGPTTPDATPKPAAGHVVFSCFVARDGTARDCRIESVTGGAAYGEIVSTWLRGGFTQFKPAMNGKTAVAGRQTYALDFGKLPPTPSR